MTRARSRFSLLGAVSAAILGLKVATPDSRQVVPQDESLSSAAYSEMGLPDPSHEWTANEFDKALGILGKIARQQLPRAGSSRSHAMFNRLLVSFAREFDLDYDRTAGHSTDTTPAQSLPALYAVQRGDGFLFDLELVEIRSQALERSLARLPTRADGEARIRTTLETIEKSNSDTERLDLGQRVKRSEEVIHWTEELVKQNCSDLLVLTAIPELRDVARQRALTRMDSLFPRLPEFLSSDGLRWITALLRGAAESGLNASIRPGLLRLAELLDSRIE